MARPTPLNAWALIFLSLALSSCQPTYPKEKVTDSVIKLCEKEYNLKDVRAKIIGKTLWVYIPLERLVDENLQLDKEMAETIEDVALNIHRVALSTDRKIDFYVLVASDIKHIGADFTMIGYVPDIKKVILMDISRGDYLQRILRDFQANPRALNDKEGRHVYISDISLPMFLAEQISRRLKQNIPQINDIQWQFNNGIFSFVLDVQRNPEIELKVREFIDRLFRSYEFTNYTDVRILFRVNPNAPALYP
jgi:hypothetical protein